MDTEQQQPQPSPPVEVIEDLVKSGEVGKAVKKYKSYTAWRTQVLGEDIKKSMRKLRNWTPENLQEKLGPWYEQEPKWCAKLNAQHMAAIEEEEEEAGEEPKHQEPPAVHIVDDIPHQLSEEYMTLRAERPSTICCQKKEEEPAEEKQTTVAEGRAFRLESPDLLLYLCNMGQAALLGLAAGVVIMSVLPK